jgi:hypothetical protein
MPKKLFLALILTISLVVFPLNTFAQENKEAGNSAVLTHPLVNAPALKIDSTASYDVQKATIKNVLKRYNSPLTDDDIDTFLQQSKKLDMNPYLLPAIFGVESQFCVAIAKGTNNCDGWAGGYYVFASYQDCIITSSETLKKKYIDKGALTVESVGKIYASSPEWPAKVNKFIRIFEEEEKKNQLLFASNAVK